MAGTRLGTSDPKGCFNIGLPSGKSLFQLQAERILYVQKLAAQSANEGSDGSVLIHLYIMTSPFIDEATRKYFERRKFFGLDSDQITFFQQGTIPSVSKDDGNGGVYTGLLEDLASRGIKFVDCYGVNNALVSGNKCSLTYTQQDMDEVRKEWAKNIMRLKN